MEIFDKTDQSINPLYLSAALQHPTAQNIVQGSISIPTKFSENLVMIIKKKAV